MTGRILAVSTLVALAQAKAIITNNCPHPVYIWSVPTAGSAHTANLSVNPGGHYEEPWRYGTTQHPGVALKVSSQSNGINTGMDEINFAYSVDHSDSSKVWIDLSPIRGKAFDNNLAFHTCHGVHRSQDVQTSKCQATDNIELVLCGTERSSPVKDSASFKEISECYDYYKDGSKHDHGDETNSSDESDDEHPSPLTVPHPPPSVACTKCPQPTTHIPVHQPPQDTSSVSDHQSKSTNCMTTTVSYPFVSPVVSTSCWTTKVTDRTTVTKPKTMTSQSPQYPEYKTKAYGTSSKPTPETYAGPPKHTSEEQYQLPKSSSKQWYSAPPKHTSDKPYSPPPKQSSGPHYEPPNHTTTQPYPPPPAYTSDKVYPPPHTTPSYLKSQYTSESTRDYTVQGRPSYHPHGDRPIPAASTSDEYEVSRPIPYRGDRWGRSALVCNKSDGKTNCSKPKPRSHHEYCKAKVVYANASSQQRNLNNTIAAPRTLTTVSLKTIMQQEAAKYQISASPVAQPNRNFTASFRRGLKTPTAANDTPTSSRKSLIAVRRTKSTKLATEVCITPFCNGLSDADCKKKKAKMEQVAKDNGDDIDYSSNPGVCKKSQSSSIDPLVQHAVSAVMSRTYATLGERADFTYCMRAECTMYNLTDAQCDRAMKLAEEIAKEELGLDVDYSISDSVCGPK